MRIQQQIVCFLLATLAACDSLPPPSCDLDPELTAAECVTARTFLLPATLPPARGNAAADDIAAATLGFKVFYDARFSVDQDTRCASCHTPERVFTDGRPTAFGQRGLPRHTQPLLSVAALRWFFWDGRADSLWSVALHPLEHPDEMGFTRLEIAHRLQRSYADAYAAAFAPLPDLADPGRFPAKGKPGDAAWEAMAPADRETVNVIAANLGKAIEAYLRKLAAGRAPFDRFLLGEAAAIGDDARRGFRAFLRAGCASCHSGADFTDERFHNLGMPSLPGSSADRGRAAGLTDLRASLFNALGPYWDGPRPGGDDLSYTDNPAFEGAFRTPPLRNLRRAAPFGHDGRFATLPEVISFHLRGGGVGEAGVLGEIDPLLRPQVLSQVDQDALVVFLNGLDGEYPTLPWATWPQR